MQPDKRKEQPYKPSHTGFDMERTQNAQKTAERSRETASDAGKGAKDTYVEDGSQEAGRRLGTSAEDVEESVERAERQSRE